MTQYGWLFVFSAGLICILVEAIVRVIGAIDATRPVVKKDSAEQKLLQVQVLAAGAETPTKPTPNDTLLLRIGELVSPTRTTLLPDGPQTPFFSFLNTLATKNVFLGAGVALLLIPALVGQGVSIDFNKTPTPPASTAPTGN